MRNAFFLAFGLLVWYNRRFCFFQFGNVFFCADFFSHEKVFV